MFVSQRHQTTGFGGRFNFQLSFAHTRYQSPPATVATQPVDDLAGGVATAVVDDQDLMVGREPIGYLNRLNHEACDRAGVAVRGEE